jgi:hypothetical protein
MFIKLRIEKEMEKIVSENHISKREREEAPGKPFIHPKGLLSSGISGR